MKKETRPGRIPTLFPTFQTSLCDFTVSTVDKCLEIIPTSGRANYRMVATKVVLYNETNSWTGLLWDTADNDWGVCSWPWNVSALRRVEPPLFVTSNRCNSVKNTSGWSAVVLFVIIVLTSRIGPFDSFRLQSYNFSLPTFLQSSNCSPSLWSVVVVLFVCRIIHLCSVALCVVTAVHTFDFKLVTNESPNKWRPAERSW